MITLNKTQRKILYLVFILVLMLLAHGSVAAKGPETNSYIVLMSEDPVATYEGDVEGLPATRAVQGQRLDRNNDKVKGYSKHLKEQHEKAVKGAGADESDITYNYTFAFNVQRRRR